MAVISCIELFSGRKADWDKWANRTYQRVFKVTTSSSFDGSLIALQAPCIPALWSEYLLPNESDLWARVTHILPQQNPQDPNDWEITVQYEAKRPTPAGAKEEDQNQSIEDPLSRPPEISWETSQYQKPTYLDPSGNPIVNSAGDIYPPLMIDDNRMTLKITRNEANFDSLTIITYRDSTNANIYSSHGANTGKMQAITAASQYEQGLYYWRVTYVIHWRDEGWAIVLADMGLNELVSNNGVIQRRRIRDRDGHPVSNPVPLDGQGHAMDPAKITAAAIAANNHSFTFYDSVDWTPLNLPGI